MFTLDEQPAADLNKLGDELTDEIPEPQQHAIDQAISDASKNPDVPGAASGSVELDALGVPWDSTQHATGKDGKGVRTEKGTWRKRRGLKGSPSHLNTGAASNKPPEESEEVKNRRLLEQQARLAGATVAMLMFRISTGIGGPQFHPRQVQVTENISYDERTVMVDAWGDYFLAKGIVDVPPGVALCGALFMYYGPRFQDPEVRKKSGKVVTWFKNAAQWVYFKFKYRGKKKPESRHEEPPKEPRSAKDYIDQARNGNGAADHASV